MVNLGIGHVACLPEGTKEQERKDSNRSRDKCCPTFDSPLSLAPAAAERCRTFGKRATGSPGLVMYGHLDLLDLLDPAGQVTSAIRQVNKTLRAAAGSHGMGNAFSPKKDDKTRRDKKNRRSLLLSNAVVVNKRCVAGGAFAKWEEVFHA